MKNKLLLITLFACGLGWGQVSMSSTGNYTQNFNTLATTGSSIAWANNNTIVNWYSQRTGSGTTYSADSGTGNSGTIYSYGTSNNADRALGTIGSGNAAAGNFAHGVLLRNISGIAITDIKVSYTLEQWRNGGNTTANTITFWYKISSSTISALNPNNNNGWTQVTGLSLSSPINTSTSAALDGNASANKVSASDVSIPSLSLADDDYLMLKWEDPDHTGSDHGLAIDDVTISWSILQNTTYTTLWSNGTGPTASLNAIIDGDLITSADLACKDLTINSGKTLTIGAGNKLTVSGNLINNGTIVFKSTSTSTAMFDTFSGNLSGSGVTTVERFIPARRAYRFLSPAVTTSTTIRQNWQENGGTAAGLGTHITGTGGATNGFDPTETNNPSLLRFTSGAWVGATNTNVSTLTAGNAYCLMVRGDRTTDITSNTPTASNTVLRATGTLFTGNFSPVLSAAASGYSFIGNPYQAPLDIKTALQSSTDVNKNVVYYWDPTINARGGYITRNLQTSQNNITSSVNDYVQPGQAFFVVNEPTLTSTPALTFTENHKSVANAAAGVFRNANTNEYGTLRVNLQANTNNQWATIDGALAIFNDTFSWNVTSEDATKMTNLDEDVSFVQNNTSLAIALQSNPSATSELPIKIDKMRHTNYKWQFELDNYNGATPYLFDTLNNSYTQINNGTAVPFTADSTTTNRFKVVFQNAVLSNATFQNTLAIYPNPAKAGASFYVEGISEATVTVSNLLGQTVPVQTKSQGTTLQVTPNTSLSQGVYLVNITTQGTTQQVKWIVE